MTHPATDPAAHPAVAAVPGKPAQLTTVFNSPVADGYIQVKVGSQVVANENLWEEKGRLMFRRKMPRTINVTKEITPVNTDIEIWVTIPTIGVKEYHAIRQNFLPGAVHRLQVSFNMASKKFDYQLN
jgi:hypothetical protein